MPIHRTQFNGYSVAFSPFLPNRIAVATSQVTSCHALASPCRRCLFPSLVVDTPALRPDPWQNFGIIGNGRQYVLDVRRHSPRSCGTVPSAQELTPLRSPP